MKKLIAGLMLLLMFAGVSVGETWKEAMCKTLKKDEVPHVIEFLQERIGFYEYLIDTSDIAEKRKFYRTEIEAVKWIIKDLNGYLEDKSTVWLK